MRPARARADIDHPADNAIPMASTIAIVAGVPMSRLALSYRAKRLPSQFPATSTAALASAPAAIASASCRHRCDTGHTSIGTSAARRNPSFHEACSLDVQQIAVHRHAANASRATNAGERNSAG